jgi:hypothetical protein
MNAPGDPPQSSYPKFLFAPGEKCSGSADEWKRSTDENILQQCKSFGILLITQSMTPVWTSHTHLVFQKPSSMSAPFLVCAVEFVSII